MLSVKEKRVGVQILDETIINPQNTVNFKEELKKMEASSMEMSRQRDRRRETVATVRKPEWLGRGNKAAECGEGGQGDNGPGAATGL